MKPQVADHSHDFELSPNCSLCGLHASVVEGGALSPEAITRKLREGHTITFQPPPVVEVLADAVAQYVEQIEGSNDG